MAARRLERLNEIKTELEASYGVSVTAAALDLSDSASSDAFYENLPADLRDNVDVLINNAGFSALPRPIVETDMDDLASVIDTNVKGVVKMIKLFVPGMLKRNTGHIINVSSVGGKASIPTGGVYCGSKHMLEAINTSLRAELVATTLRVTLISPGLTETEFSLVRFKDEDKAAQAYKGIVPLTGADIADTMVYAASRPPHVQVVDIFTLPTAQASIHLLHREPSK